MAYNVLKGTVEGSVDQHADQEIGGVKVFKSTISASVFYDTDAQSPCATMRDVAFTEVVGARPTAVLTYGGETTAVANHNMLFDGETLHVKNIAANELRGTAKGLTHLPPDRFVGPINAGFINHGLGLQNVRETLQVKPGNGLVVDEEGLSVSTAIFGGLRVKSNCLIVDPSKTEPITLFGQNLSDDDVLLVSDVSKDETRHSTLKNLYDGYIKPKMPAAAGTTGQIQLKANNGFGASKRLSFDTRSGALSVEGTVSTLSVQIEKSLVCKGAVTQGIKKITAEEYEVANDDHTILCDSVGGSINVTLPPACNNTGRVLVIKKTNTDKYNLKSHPVTIKVSEGKIDLTDIVTLKMNYSSRTLQSDGANWWIIGQKGT